MRTPPLLADFTYSRDCKPICEKSLTLPVYTTLLTSGKLNSYLADIDKQATDMMFRLVEQMADKEGVTEQLKAESPMLWVGKMNEIQASAREVVNNTLIFS